MSETPRNTSEATLTLELTAAEVRACENAVSFAGYDYFGDPAFVNALMAKLTEARRLSDA